MIQLPGSQKQLTIRLCFIIGYMPFRLMFKCIEKNPTNKNIGQRILNSRVSAVFRTIIHNDTLWWLNDCCHMNSAKVTPLIISNMNLDGKNLRIMEIKLE